MCAEGPLDKRGLSEHYGVTVHAVNEWRKDGLPALEERGSHNRLLFDLEEVDDWLAAQGIVPGARGVEGGHAAQGTVPGHREAAVDATELPDDIAEGQTLEDTLRRLHVVEQHMAERIMGTAGTKQQGTLRSWKDIIDQLRKLTKSLREEQEKRGELVPREVLVQQMSSLAGVLKSAVQQFPQDMAPRVVALLNDEGIELENMARFERSLISECEGLTDAWLNDLSEGLRGQVAADGD